MNDLHKGIIEYFEIIRSHDELHPQLSKQDILPKGIFEKDDEFFILHGRYIETRTAMGDHRFNDDIFCKGNAIDIIGHYLTHEDIKDRYKGQDIYSCFGKDDKRRRYLEVFNKETPQELDIKNYFANVSYVYKDGIYVPELKKVHPERVELIEISRNNSLNSLKKKDSFREIASIVLGNQNAANELTVRYFN